MSAICIIPARGGSKRIPRKNIRPLRGRPLLSWVITTAIESRCFDEIMVSTEDEEIATVAQDSGASVPFMRSDAAATDDATTTDVINEVLAMYASRGSTSFDLACCIYPTAALVKPGHLRVAKRRLDEDPNLDSALTVQAYRHPIERAYRVKEGLLSAINPEWGSTRTQDLSAAYHDAGQFCWFRPSQLAKTGRLLGTRCAPLELQLWEAVDLDNEADWRFLEKLARNEDICSE